MKSLIEDLKKGKPSGWDIARVIAGYEVYNAHHKAIGVATQEFTTPFEISSRNIIQWDSRYGIPPKEVFFKAHVVIIDGYLVKDRDLIQATGV